MKLKVLVHLKTSNGTLTQGKILNDKECVFCPSILAEVKALEKTGSSKNIEILPGSFKTPTEIAQDSQKNKTADAAKAAEEAEDKRLKDEEALRLADEKKEQEEKS